MPNFTPGPWHLSAGGLYVRKNDTPGWPAWNICELNSAAGQWEHNAALIVAAPQLYAALALSVSTMPLFAQAIECSGYRGHGIALRAQLDTARALLDQIDRPLARSKGGDAFALD